MVTAASPSEADYAKLKTAERAVLHVAQIELVKLQRHVIETSERLRVLHEGRNTAGKDSTIERMVQHLSPREKCVFALGAPSDRDRTAPPGSWPAVTGGTRVPVILTSRAESDRSQARPAPSP